MFGAEQTRPPSHGIMQIAVKTSQHNYKIIIVCHGRVMVTTFDFQPGRLGLTPSCGHYSMRLDPTTEPPCIPGKYIIAVLDEYKDCGLV